MTITVKDVQKVPGHYVQPGWKHDMYLITADNGKEYIDNAVLHSRCHWAPINWSSYIGRQLQIQEVLNSGKLWAKPLL
jgi:hypothetical protein